MDASAVYEYGKVTEDLKVIEKGEPIFVRLEAEEEIKYIQDQMKV